MAIWSLIFFSEKQNQIPVKIVYWGLCSLDFWILCQIASLVPERIQNFSFLDVFSETKYNVSPANILIPKAKSNGYKKVTMKYKNCFFPCIYTTKKRKFEMLLEKFQTFVLLGFRRPMFLNQHYTGNITEVVFTWSTSSILKLKYCIWKIG